MTMQTPALVIGAGISGLVCAHALQKSGIGVQVLESSRAPGGVIQSIRRDGFLVELGPQSFLATPPILALCEELGIAQQLLKAPANAPRYVLTGGELREVPLSPPAFFTSRLFTLKTKFSVLRDAIGRSSPAGDDETVAKFVRRKFSPELLEKLVGPFVSGIYAGDPEHLSLRAAFPQLYEAEKTQGSVIRGLRSATKKSPQKSERPALQTFQQGNETLIAALAAKLGTNLRCGVKVMEIQPVDDGGRQRFEVSVVEDGQEKILQAGAIILATPALTSAALLENIDSNFTAPLTEIDYAPIAVVSLGYQTSSVQHSLQGFGFLVPRSSGLQTLGSVWNSSIFPGRAPNGCVLLTSFVGGVTNPQACSGTAQDLAALVHREIAPLLKICQQPIFSNVERYARAIPQYNVGHNQRMAALEQLRISHPNLWLAGNYISGPSWGACVERSLAVAEEVSRRDLRERI